MIEFCQGDIIKFSGGKSLFLIISKNYFINNTGMFHVCPIINISKSTVHIPIVGKLGCTGTVACEQIKLIDPQTRSCSRVDSIPYDEIINISDTIQSIFEYD